MRSMMKHSLIVWLAVSFVAVAFGAQDRGAVVERVRAELATVLKKEAAKLPVDKPVVELGANDLHVIEWVMALDEAFHVRIRSDNAKIFDQKTKKVRKDFSITSMVEVVMTAPPRPGAKKK